MTDSDKRQYRRYAVELAAEVLLRGEVVVASTQNLSLGGVGLALDRALPKGAIVGVTLFLTQDGIEDPDTEPFESKAVVMWAKRDEGGAHIVGVQFSKVTEPQKRALQAFLTALG